MALTTAKVTQLIDKIIAFLYPSIFISWLLAIPTGGLTAIWTVIGSAILLALAVLQGILTGQLFADFFEDLLENGTLGKGT